MYTTFITDMNEYCFVLFVFVYSVILNIFLVMQVSKARKEHGIEYPNLYADRTIDGEVKANNFNQVQRAHQNTLEERDNILIMMAINGFFHPFLAATFGFFWVTARFLYGMGYANSGPKGRTLGFALS